MPISYGAKAQLMSKANTSECLEEHHKHRIQEIVGSLLYYAQAVDNKLLVALSTIAARQSYATVSTEQAVHLLLDYVATYPADGIVYRASDMILCAHADTSFLNETNSCSRAGAHIFLLENDPFPRFYGAILSIAQIIKFVMASAAESELAALFITAREMIPHRQTLIALGWPQPKSPIQTDNSTAAGVTNKTIVPRRQDDGYAPMVAPMPRLTKPTPLLLGQRIQELGQLPYQAPPGHLPRSAPNHTYRCRGLGTTRSIVLVLLLPNRRPLQVFPFYFTFSKLLSIISPHYECCHKGV